jgi:hypothetical protein
MVNRTTTTSFLLTLLCALSLNSVVLVAGGGAVRIDVADRKAMARLRRRLPYDEEKEDEKEEGKFVYCRRRRRRGVVHSMLQVKLSRASTDRQWKLVVVLVVCRY